MTRGPKTSSFALAGAFAAIVCAAGDARAQDAPADPAARAAQVQKLSEEGTALYQQRDYRHANERFQQAYAVDPDPNLLYNIAKCYEALGDKQTAIEKYELFINSPGADSKGRVRAQEAVRLLRAPPTETPPAAPTKPVAKQAPAAGGVETSPNYAPAIIAFGVGGAGVVVGSVFGALALHKRAALNAACTNDHACPPNESGDVNSLKTTSTVSTVGFVVGGVGVALGATLFVLARPGDRATGAFVSPYLGLGGGGVTGRF